MIKLKVAEAIQDDVNTNVVRIDSKFMKSLNIKPGDIVELQGKRKTVAIADTVLHGDVGIDIIRMDGLIRRNAKTGIGELAKVRKTEVKEAKRVTIAPARKGVIVRASPNIFKQGLLGRAVLKGDIVVLGGSRKRRTAMSDSPFFEDIFNILDESMMGFGFGDLKFKVVKTEPSKPVIITNSTDISLRECSFLTQAEEYIINRTDEYEAKIRSENDLKKLMKLREEVKNLKVVITKPVLKILEKSKTQLLKLIDKKIKTKRPQ